jgi:uncharacterized RDD family membrane protein YckC
MPPPSDPPVPGPAGLLRRLGAMLYDALLVLALWMVTLFVLVTVNGGHFVYGGVVQTILFLELYGFFAYFWMSGGETIGMKAWRIRLANEGARLSLNQVTMRFIGAIVGTALLGIGYLWLYVDRGGRTWGDILSGSLVVHVPRD